MSEVLATNFKDELSGKEDVEEQDENKPILAKTIALVVTRNRILSFVKYI